MQLSEWLTAQADDSLHTIREFKRGDRIYSTGDTPEYLYLVSSGLVGLTILSPAGAEHLLRLFGRGSYFGHRSFLAQETYHADAIALEPTRIYCVPGEFVRSALKNDFQLTSDLLQQLARDLGRAERQRVDWLEADVNSRVAQALIYLKERYGQHRWTRAEIASFCGSTVSTVIKTMARFEDQGWISQQGREIIVRDRHALLALSAEDS
jgi:CRP-like cAMP-binding protein